MNERLENIRYSLLISCHTMMLCVGMNFVTYYLAGANIPDSAIGAVTAIGCIIAVVLQQVSGRAVDTGRVDVKKLLMILSLVIVAAGGLLLFITPSLIVGILYASLISVTLIMMPMVNSYSFYYRDAGLSVNYGIARGVGSLCFSGISMLLGYLTVHAGRYVVPLSYAILGVIMLIILFSMPTVRSMGTVDKAQRKSFRLSQYPAFVWMIVGLMLVMLFHNMVMTYFIYVIENVGGNSQDMGMAIGIAAIVEIPVLFLYTKVKKDRSSAGFLLISGFTFLLKAILFIFAKNIWMIYGIQCLQCLAYGLMAASRVYYVDETVGDENEATGQSYMSATETIGLVLGSAFGGLIMQHFGVNVLLVFGAVICSVGACCMTISVLSKIRSST